MSFSAVSAALAADAQTVEDRRAARAAFIAQQDAQHRAALDLMRDVRKALAILPTRSLSDDERDALAAAVWEDATRLQARNVAGVVQIARGHLMGEGERGRGWRDVAATWQSRTERRENRERAIPRTDTGAVDAASLAAAATDDALVAAGTDPATPAPVPDDLAEVAALTAARLTADMAAGRTVAVRNLTAWILRDAAPTLDERARVIAAMAERQGRTVNAVTLDASRGAKLAAEYGREAVTDALRAACADVSAADRADTAEAEADRADELPWGACSAYRPRAGWTGPLWGEDRQRVTAPTWGETATVRAPRLSAAHRAALDAVGKLAATGGAYLPDGGHVRPIMRQGERLGDGQERDVQSVRLYWVAEDRKARRTRLGIDTVRASAYVALNDSDPLD